MAYDDNEFSNDRDGYSRWIRREKTLNGLNGQGGTSQAQQPSQPQQPSPTTYDTSQWDTDSYSAPQYIAPSYGNVMGGWSADNWANPNMQTPKYAIGRILSNYPSTVEGLSQAMAEIQKAYPGTVWNGKDTITVPGLGSIDVLAGAGAPGSSWWWGDLSQGGGGGGQMPTSTLGGLSQALSVGNGGSIPLGNTRMDTGALPRDPMQDAYRSQVMRLLQRNPEDITLEETARLPQAQAYRAAAERGRRERLAGEQERLASQGLEQSGAADAALASGYQDMAQNVSSYNANLMGEELTARRAELQSAIQTAQQWGLADEANQLQRQLANLDAQMRMVGYGIQRELGLGGLSLDAQRIANQNQQYYDELGWNMAQYQNDSNFRNYVLAMLGQG